MQGISPIQSAPTVDAPAAAGSSIPDIVINKHLRNRMKRLEISNPQDPLLRGFQETFQDTSALEKWLDSSTANYITTPKAKSEFHERYEWR
ncbi:hypothetical protein BGX31_000919 [Mortierella sp. GBA43]|nr:hypothetical protein BGX31_000919 [Mortierella sp. GBA43]